MLVYCDYIMHRIRSEMLVAQHDYMASVQLTSVGSTQYDVDEGGALASTKKTLMVRIGEKAYRVTVEEA